MPQLFSHAQPDYSNAFDELVATVHTLLADDGCQWDRQQTHESLAKYLIEETYEAVEAMESGDPDDLAEELGDVLYQVVFHAEIAARSHEGFDIDDVVSRVTQKMRRRHPHVFDGAEAADVAQISARWQEIKAQEKPERDSVLDGIPSALPALAYASKVVSRGRSLGVLGNEQAAAASFPIETEQDLGRMLLALVAAGSARGLDAESALRKVVRELSGELRQAELDLGDGGVVARGQEV